MMTSPPLPPSPPDGPPCGTYFSRRKARQPFPPSPAFTRMMTSSINIEKPPGGIANPAARFPSWSCLLYGADTDIFAQPPAIVEFHYPGDLGKQRVILAPAHVHSRLQLRAALPHNNGSTRNQLTA